MLSMPRIVRPDPFPELGSPLDRQQADPLSETKNHAALRQFSSQGTLLVN
jgi:hypothetical protein